MLHVNAPIDPYRADDTFPLAGERIVVVGNAADVLADASAIDAADCVIRFNNASGFGGRTGSRVTHLALVNRGGQMREWLADPDFTDRPVIRAAQAFILPFPMLPAERNLPDQTCWTREILTLLQPLGKPIHILSQALHERAWNVLASRCEGRPNPSTGFLVTFAILLGRPSAAQPVDVWGFGFDGWPGHPWAAERAWFEGARADRRLRLHPSEK